MLYQRPGNRDFNWVDPPLQLYSGSLPHSGCPEYRKPPGTAFTSEPSTRAISMPESAPGAGRTSLKVKVRFERRGHVVPS